ncbi:low-complexity tail membrane protein [Planktothrix sp. FACHB-1355]|uniref:Low-complexity tail membrane protein n=1 Tax=Aerosakkonema funiforme FACHB-1375 TaxID=2949571 RepID=A0A926ZIX5_9CYAN|nr:MULTISPECIES: low-complexity tail membrane protein [Oscillatoriales]MBD2182271.1 low-complexity tail membrane protein [Aerosakkonema funiforme FACHB-1375]MBD3559470.1 low-complexity tail membrane protein [Planktothrix sp. FACHB-1355]
MRSFWSEPFLWIHLAGLAALPILLVLCWLGLAVGDPILPVWLELLLIVVVGIAPVLWMQLFRHFNIFSILILALKPEKLTQEQRKILSLFKKPLQRVLAIAAPILLVAILWQLYRAAPIAAPFAPFPPEWRFAGLLLAAAAFLLCNLFLQVPISVLAVLMTSESAFAATEPYPLEKIRQDFTIPGWQVNQILPFINVQEKQSSSASAPIIEDAGSKPSNSSNSI